MSTAHSSRYATLVYFVQAGDDGPIKIGQTRAFAARFRDLQVSSSVPLRCLATVPTRGPAQVSERGLHARFRRFRLHGEWFSPAPEIMEYIAAHGRPGLPTSKSNRKRRGMSIAPTVDLAEACQAIVIDAAIRAGLDRRTIQRGLRISKTTFYRRKALADEVKAAREAEAVYSRTEGGCV